MQPPCRGTAPDWPLPRFSSCLFLLAVVFLAVDQAQPENLGTQSAAPYTVELTLPYLSPPLPVPPCFSRIDLAVLPSRPPSSQYGEDSTPLPSDNAMAAGGTAASQRAVPPCTGTSSFSYPLHSCVLSLPCLSVNVTECKQVPVRREKGLSSSAGSGRGGACARCA